MRRPTPWRLRPAPAPRVATFRMKSQRMIERVKSRLKRFYELRPGWHFGEGVAIPGEAIERAIGIVEETSRKPFDTIDVSPNPDGSILILITDRDLEIEIEITISQAKEGR